MIWVAVTVAVHELAEPFLRMHRRSAVFAKSFSLIGSESTSLAALGVLLAANVAVLVFLEGR